MKLRSARGFFWIVGIAIGAPVAVAFFAVGEYGFAFSLFVATVFLTTGPMAMDSIRSIRGPGFEVTFQELKATLAAVPTNEVAMLPGFAVPQVAVSERRGLLPYTRIYTNTDPTLKYLSFRFELEARLAQVATAARDAGLTVVSWSEPPDRLADALQFAGVITPAVATGVKELIALGDRIAHGARLTTDVFDQDPEDRLSFLLNMLGYLAADLEAKTLELISLEGHSETQRAKSK